MLLEAFPPALLSAANNVSPRSYVSWITKQYKRTILKHVHSNFQHDPTWEINEIPGLLHRHTYHQLEQ
jgi:hypothetical protein